MRVSRVSFGLWIAVVGKGGFGKVNACIKRDTKEILAMKHMQKATILAKGGKRNLEALWVERDLMCVVKSPFVVNLLYAFQNQTEIFFIMPFMKGRSFLRFFFFDSLSLIIVLLFQEEICAIICSETERCRKSRPDSMRVN